MPKHADRLTEDQQRLVAENMRLIDINVGLAMRQYGHYMDDDELRSIAHVGLVKAAIQYDGKRGAAFGTWATYRIRNEFKDALRSVNGRMSTPGGKRKARLANLTVRLDDQVQESDRQSVPSALSVEHRDFESVDAKDEQGWLLRGTSTDQRLLVKMCYGAGATLKQAGAALGWSESRASQLRSQAMNIVRDNVARRVQYEHHAQTFRA